MSERALNLLKSLGLVLVWGGIFMGIAWFISPPSARLTPQRAGALRWSGAAMILLGTVACLRCMWDFAITGRGTSAPFDPPKALVARGLYRRVRNPIYLGGGLIVIGAALVFAPAAALGSWRFWAVLAAWAIGIHLMVVLWEEPQLHRRFGAEYEAYCRQTPRWWPRI